MGGSGWWGGGSGWWGVRVNLNVMLGVGGDVGCGGCEPRIEGVVHGGGSGLRLNDGFDVKLEIVG